MLAVYWRYWSLKISIISRITENMPRNIPGIKIGAQEYFEVILQSFYRLSPQNFVQIKTVWVKFKYFVAFCWGTASMIPLISTNHKLKQKSARLQLWVFKKKMLGLFRLYEHEIWFRF